MQNLSRSTKSPHFCTVPNAENYLKNQLKTRGLVVVLDAADVLKDDVRVVRDVDVPRFPVDADLHLPPGMFRLQNFEDFSSRNVSYLVNSKFEISPKKFLKVEEKENRENKVAQQLRIEPLCEIAGAKKRPGAAGERRAGGKRRRAETLPIN